MDESESLVGTKTAKVSKYRCLPCYGSGTGWRMTWLKNNGAVLTIIWSFLVTHVYHLLRAGPGVSNFGLSSTENNPRGASIGGIILLSGALLCPVGGWIADAHYGRYRTVRCSIWIMWIGALLATLADILSYVSEAYNDDAKVWVFRVLFVLMAIGGTGFFSNIVQLGVDQLKDATNYEIKSYILWFGFAFYLSCLTTNFITECFASEYGMVYTRTLLVAACLSVVICLDYLCKHWIVKEEVTGQSLSEVLKIIRYVVKNRRMRYEFITDENALEELPSRFDIAKHQYGGPFTTTRVNNVRTFLWILAVLATCAIVFGATMPVEYAREKIQHRWDRYEDVTGLMGCYQKLTLRYEDYLWVCILVLSYEFVVRPLFHRHFPKISMAGKFIFASGLFLLWILSLLAIESVAAYNSSTAMNSSVIQECIFYEVKQAPEFKVEQIWLLIPDMIGGIACFLLLLTAVEFIWAQTPSSMKGLMFGCASALLGFNTLVQSAIAFPFLFTARKISWHLLTCGVWYLAMEGALILVVLVIIIVVVRRYKNRSPNRIVYE